MRGGSDLRRGQVVELFFDEDPPIPERCTVVWVGKAGSRQEGEVGLETLRTTFELGDTGSELVVKDNT